MSVTVEHVFEEALHLTEESRILLAERILESISPNPEILAAQISVAAERADELDAGKTRGIPGQEALR